MKNVPGAANEDFERGILVPMQKFKNGHERHKSNSLVHDSIRDR